MHAMVLHQQAPIDTGPLESTERAAPTPGPGEVRLKVRCCAVCRTDLHVVEGDLPPKQLPIVPGHQTVGIVDQVGEGCERLRLGERVGVAWLRHTCGECAYCKTGRENLCPHTRFTGYHADGGFADYELVPEAFAYRIPDAFNDEDAAPLLCAGIIGYRSLQRAAPTPNCKLALHGFGSSAHVVIQIALHRGYEVYVATRGEHHQQLARDMGAHPSELPVHVDSAVILAPAGELVPPALETLAPGGTLALAGIYMSQIPAMDYETHLFHEKQVRSVTCNTRADGEALLEEAAAIPIRPHTTIYPLREANRALQDLKADRMRGTGVLRVEA